MRNLSVRGLGDDALADLKRRASDEGTSVNALVLRLLEQGLGRQPLKGASRRRDDLDALAGCWRKDEAARFDRAVAPFGEVDPALWK